MGVAVVMVVMGNKGNQCRQKSEGCQQAAGQSMGCGSGKIGGVSAAAAENRWGVLVRICVINPPLW